MSLDYSEEEETIQIDFSDEPSETETLITQSEESKLESTEISQDLSSKSQDLSKNSQTKKNLGLLGVIIFILLSATLVLDEDQIVLSEVKNVIEDFGLYSFDESSESFEDYSQIHDDSMIYDRSSTHGTSDNLSLLKQEEKELKAEKNEDKEVLEEKTTAQNNTVKLSKQKNFLNAYWPIPLPSIPSMKKKILDWDRETELRWSNMINHNIIWQRFLVLDEIEKNPKIGAETLLFESFGGNKLWLNFKILALLIDYNVMVSRAKLASVLSKERDSLISNYFKRFRSKQSEKNTFLMLQVLPVVSKQSRFTILKNLKFYGVENHLIYFIAALSDESKKIRDFARKELTQRGLKYFQIESIKNTYFKILSFETSYKEGLEAIERAISLKLDS